MESYVDDEVEEILREVMIFLMNIQDERLVKFKKWKQCIRRHYKLTTTTTFPEKLLPLFKSHPLKLLAQCLKSCQLDCENDKTLLSALGQDMLNDIIGVIDEKLLDLR